MTVEEAVVARTSCQTEDDKSSNILIKKERQKNKKMKSLMKKAEKADKRGVCYLNPAAQVRRKKSGGFQGQEFSEGWVEFTERGVAKRVANMLNGEQIAIKNATREQKLTL